MQTRAKHQAGFSLVEVLVAAAIFSLGVLAVVKLQGEFLRGSSEADSRSVAVQLAQQKIDDLRRFGAGTGGAAFAFTEIDTNAGGAKNANGALNMPADASTSNGANVIGNTDYSLSWTVTPQYFGTASPLSQTAVTDPAGSASTTVTQKLVDVTVSWVDQAGTTQSVQLADIINSMAPDAAAGLSGGPSAGAGAAKTGPEVTYTPSSSPEVVPVSVGDQGGTHRETLTPTVDASGRTTFNSYTYNASNKLVREEEFETVACVCRFNGSDTTAGNTPGHAEWDSTSDTYKDVKGDAVTKTKGCVQGGGSNCDNNPESFCDTCCKDHHDAGSSAVDSAGVKYCDPANGITDRCYDPFRSGDYDASGNHQHYSTALVPVTSGQYVESCRFKRIDGYWRLYQDWHQVKQASFPESVLTDSALKTEYVNYVIDLIDEHLTEGAVSGQTLSSPPTRPAAITFDAGNPTRITTGATEQETARGVYLDYLGATHLAAVLAKKAQNVDYLLDVPFYEISLTSMATWSSANTAKVKVGPSGRGASALASGKIEGIAATNTTAVTSSIRKSNSGLAGQVSPDGVDFASGLANADNVHATDSIAVCVDCTTTSTSTTSSTTTTTSTTTSSAATTSTTAATTTTTAASTSTTSSTAATTTTTTVAGATTTTAVPTRNIDITITPPSGYTVNSGGAVTASYTGTINETVSCQANPGPTTFRCTVSGTATSGTITFSGGITKTANNSTKTCSASPGVWPAGNAATITLTVTGSAPNCN